MIRRQKSSNIEDRRGENIKLINQQEFPSTWHTGLKDKPKSPGSYDPMGYADGPKSYANVRSRDTKTLLAAIKKHIGGK